MFSNKGSAPNCMVMLAVDIKGNSWSLQIKRGDNQNNEDKHGAHKRRALYRKTAQMSSEVVR
jgi:hypothetical protein